MAAQDTPRMYILVDMGLKMGRGKIAGQCCHVACAVTRTLERNTRHGQYSVYKRWLELGETKIVLQADHTLLERVITMYPDTSRTHTFACYVYDLGLTQIPPNTLTAVALSPMTLAQTPDFIKQLKLV